MSNVVDTYTHVLQALAKISEGKTMTEACRLAGISTTALKRYCQENNELTDMFNEAEQHGYDVMADSLVNIDQHAAMLGVTDPRVMAILSKNLQWYLSRKRPSQYGDRMIVENVITADRAIIEALDRGKARALAVKTLDDVTYRVVDDVVPALPAPRIVNLDELDEELHQFV